MVGDEQLTEYARALAELYEQAELEMLEAVARRLARGIEQPGWAEAKLAEIQALRAHHASILEKYLKGATELISAGTRLAWDSSAPPLFQSEVQIRTNQAAVEALVRETVLKLQTSGVQILRQAEDIYRSTVADALRLSVSGTLTRKQATQRALEGFAAKGISGFTDSRGRNWEISSYAEMAARTGYQRAQLAGNLANYSQRGRDLVHISISPEPCPICDPYEGRVFSISGTHPTYPPLNHAMAGGLFHANCTHRALPYIEGLTRPVTAAEKYNKRGENKYPERQEQRRLERQIRKYKRLAAVAPPEAKARADKRVRQAQAQLRGFISDTGRLRQRGREQLFNTVAAARKREERLARRAAQGKLILDLTRPLPRGTDLKTLKEWAAQKYPAVDWDIDGIDPDYAADMLTQLDRLATEWPGVFDKLRLVGFGTSGSSLPSDIDWEAQTAPVAVAEHIGGYRIYLNPKYARDYAALREFMAGQVKHFSSGDMRLLGSADPMHVIIHEFGHLVDAHMMSSHYTTLPFTTDDEETRVGYLWQQFRYHAFQRQDERAAPNRVSFYSDVSSVEALAEGFATLYTNPNLPAPYLEDLREAMDVLQPGQWQYKQEEVPNIKSLPPKDRRKAKEQLAAIRRRLGIPD